MSWLRIDDGFVDHPKFDGWTKTQRWRWLELMSWCARQRTQGRVPTGAQDRRTSELYAKALACGLLDAVGDELWMHDWSLYNGDLAARVAAYCEKYPQATANEVLRFTGGKRQVVLEMVREYRLGGSPSGSPGTSQPVDNGGAPVSLSGSRAGSGPQPHQELPSVSPSRSALRRAREGSTDGLTSIDDDVQRQLDELRAHDQGLP